MGGPVVARQDGTTAQPPHRSGDPALMTSPVTSPQLPVRLSQHEIVVARLSADHDHGEHESPFLACLKCLHGEAPASVTLRKAA